MFDGDIFISLHLYSAVLAVLLSVLQLSVPRGQGFHRVLGYGWMLLILVVALSSFAIHEIKQFGDYSAIHFLSVLTLLGMGTALLHARGGRIAAHRRNIILLLAGLYVAGVFSLLPGRRLGDWLWAMM